MGRISFLGCPIDNLDYPGVLNWMEGRIRSKSPAMIAVVNANKLWMMSRNSRLEKIVKGSSLIVPEWAVVWGAKKLGLPLHACVYGVVLAQESLYWAQEKGYRVFFLGAKNEVVERLVMVIKEKFPGLQIAGFHHGYLDPFCNQAVVGMIKSSKPDVLFVAMGSPKQEYWITDHFNELGVPVSMGIGGTFDVLAGLKKDTPSWARGHGLEWLYRLSQDPKAYWKRYLIANSWIIWNVLKDYMHTKLARKHGA